mmetsp:Transcript_7604/g.12103  ORF Transcript_7604/g.12103 Transcript_7604/m.12103 type:complete len:185 (-) Transcript_7604:2042-2596(-)
MDTDFELGASSKTLYFDTKLEDAVQWPATDHGEIEEDTVLTIGGERAPSDENTDTSWWHWNQPATCENFGGQVCTYGGDECSLVRREGEYLFNQWHDSKGINRMTSCSKNSGQGVHAVTSAALKCGLTTLIIQATKNHSLFVSVVISITLQVVYIIRYNQELKERWADVVTPYHFKPLPLPPFL